MVLSLVARPFAWAAKDFAVMDANRPAQARRQGEKRQVLARPAGEAEDTARLDDDALCAALGH